MWEIIDDYFGYKTIHEFKDNIDYENEPLEHFKSLLLDVEQVIFPPDYIFSFPNLPDNIKSIIIHDAQKLEINLPSKLENLQIYSQDNYHKISEFPKTLKKIVWFCKLIDNLDLSLSMLPNWIEELTIGSITFTCSDITNFTHLNTLKIINPNFNQHLDCLPDTIQYLEIKSIAFNQTLNHLPLFLKELELNIYYNNVDGMYTQELANLPPNMKKLTIINYKGNLDHLPNNLEYLKIQYEHSFDTITLNNLPDSITTIEFGSDELLHLREHTFKIPKNCKKITYQSNTNLNMDDHKFLLTQKGLKIINKYYVI
jgi:hypothetical protein